MEEKQNSESKLPEIEVAQTELSPKEVKKNKPRSVQTLYRSMLANLVRQTRIADQKAALMISVNSVIISFTVSFMAGQINDYPFLISPTIILLGVCLLAIIFSILASRPKINNNVTDESDLLFFGHFSKFGKEEYITAMRNMVSDEKELQNKIIGSIHAQGKVLNSKYTFLKIAYNVFMIGFPVAIVLYAILLAILI